MDDIDFKAKVTRAEFEELCTDLFERVPRPVQDALAVAEMKLVSILRSRSVRRSQMTGYDETLMMSVGRLDTCDCRSRKEFGQEQEGRSYLQ